MSRFLLRFAATLACVVGLSLGLWSGAAHAQSTVIAVDADASTSAIDGTVSAAVGTEVRVRVALVDLGISGYTGYQVKLFYDDAILDASGVPSNWSSAPTDTTGGNVASFPSGGDCVPSTSIEAIQDNDINGDTEEDDEDTNSMLMGCLDDAVAVISDLQPLVEFRFTCAASGTSALTLAERDDGQGGTYVTDDEFEPVLDDTLGASIVCGGAAPSPTSGAASPSATAATTVQTPVPSASSPTAAGQGIVAPDTGMGDSESRDGGNIGLRAMLLFLIGISAFASGIARLAASK